MDLLSNVRVFSQLTPGELETLSSFSKRRSFKQNEHIFHHGDGLTHLYFVLTGSVKIYRNDISGREQIVSFQQERDMFPHIGIFKEGVYPANALAMENTTLATISVQDFKILMQTIPNLPIQLYSMMEDKIMDLQQRLEEMILNNANERVILLLNRLAKSHGNQNSNGSVTLNAKFTNAELANMIGTTRETVNRTVSRLRSEGLLKVAPNGFLRFHPEQLEDDILDV